MKFNLIGLLKKVRRVINMLIWTVAGLYLAIIALLHIPAMQNLLGSKVSEALGQKLGTEVRVGNIDLGMLNRVIIDDVLIKDQERQVMLRAPRLSVKVGLGDLLKGKITISSAQIFGLKANLYKQTADSKPNFQFVLDSLASKDTTKHTPLNIEISSLIIRRGEIAYNQLDDQSDGLFSPKHVNLKDISAHLILYELTDDSLELSVKKIALKDNSGFELKKVTLYLLAGKQDATMTDFNLELPESQIHIPELKASYELEKKKLKAGTLKFKGKIIQSVLTPCDLGAFIKLLRGYNTPISLNADVDGTDRDINIRSISVFQGKDLQLVANGAINNIGQDCDWQADIVRLNTSSKGIKRIAGFLGKDDAIPSVINNIGSITLTGNATKKVTSFKGKGKLQTGIGKADININKVGTRAVADIAVENLNLHKLTTNKDFGLMTAKISATGNVTGTKVLRANGHANIGSFTFKGHTYRNVKATADYMKGRNISADINMMDYAGFVKLTANYNLASRIPKGNINGKVLNLDLAKLGITKKWDGSTFDFEIDGEFTGRNIRTGLGHLAITNFIKHTGEEDYRLRGIDLNKFIDGDTHRVTFISDFASVWAEGDFDPATLVNSVKNAVYDRLPTIPGLKKKPVRTNHIKLSGIVNDASWLQSLFGIDLEFYEPTSIIASIDDSQKKVDIRITADDFAFKGQEYQNGSIYLSCPNDTMKALINANMVNGNKKTHYQLKAMAIDNNLNTSIEFSSKGKISFNGQVNTDANFYTGENGMSTAEVKVLPSTVYINDTVWSITPANMKYFANNIEVNKLSIHHDDQHITIDGKVTKNPLDEINVDLKDVNVSYFLNIVNFHSVEFAGYASGTAKARSLFTKPEADARLHVKNFTFENGCLGDLDVTANWNLEDGAINVNGTAIDDGDRKTVVTGFISPKNNNIGLNVKAWGTSLKFLNTYCDSFMSDIDVYGWGEINVVGPLKKIELVGKAKVKGSARVTSLNTTYYLRGDSVTLLPDDIVFSGDSIYDRDGHLGIVNGHLRHQHLGNFTYDIGIDAKNLLAYDTHDFGDMNFFGTAFVTGSCGIRGKSGEVVIDVDATPEQGTQVVYNVASPDQLTNQEFLTWHNRDSIRMALIDEEGMTKPSEKDMSANIHLNFSVHANTKASVKLLMDRTSGDYIQLFGNGAITASYYNKGSFDMYGNYVVDHGIYKLTIQNVIKRDFEFLQGGTISFGGDAYSAALNLRAQYTVNAVSLSDLNLGKSFSNNIRVNCLMDITGTPSQPRVDFAFDMPTVSSEVKQMVMSLMNSEEEMKEQVVYLLAIGRFMNQGSNNSSTATAMGQTQTSLAMQSILSGTISQQLSSILSSVVKDNNWNFGANISTGDEGLYNAEYEGTVSGHLLNNRLLINGQFGYRDNQTTNSTFIGDFDVRYMLVPTGSMAIKIYNQTNDRYFTKNSLNTQGVGLIFKKDFNGWRDFFRFRNRKRITGK